MHPNAEQSGGSNPISSNNVNNNVQFQSAAQRECRKYANPLEDYILEGSAAKPGEFPWMVKRSQNIWIQRSLYN